MQGKVLASLFPNFRDEIKEVEFDGFIARIKFKYPYYHSGSDTTFLEGDLLQIELEEIISSTIMGMIT